jgi:hypothetical protein
LLPSQTQAETPGKTYPLSPAKTQSLEEYINDALALGRIRPSRSPLGAPCFFVKKPNGGLRLCIDYRGLNAIMQKNAYPLPLISDIFDCLGKARRFSRLDLPEAYHLLRIKKGDEWKTAFLCKFGSFEYKVMPFGLMNAPAAFQFFMNDIFADLQHECLVIYLDDLSSSPLTLWTTIAMFAWFWSVSSNMTLLFAPRNVPSTSRKLTSWAILSQRMEFIWTLRRSTQSQTGPNLRQNALFSRF